MRILLLEDDHLLCASLKEFLELENYIVDVAHRGTEVFDLTFTQEYDLYILDVNVPEVDGFDILSELRDSGDVTPAIYITALTDINSISRGFTIGADDYIKKPFDPEELAIRIKSKYQKEDDFIFYQNLRYNPRMKTIEKDAQLVMLGEVQQNLLHELMMNKKKVVESFVLMEYLKNPSANALRVNIAKLKNKLGIEIRNVRGQGYMIEGV